MNAWPNYYSTLYLDNFLVIHFVYIFNDPWPYSSFILFIKKDIFLLINLFVCTFLWKVMFISFLFVWCTHVHRLSFSSIFNFIFVCWSFLFEFRGCFWSFELIGVDFWKSPRRMYRLILNLHFFNFAFSKTYFNFECITNRLFFHFRWFIKSTISGEFLNFVTILILDLGSIYSWKALFY